MEFMYMHYKISTLCPPLKQKFPHYPPSKPWSLL
jgi:hypothetical protein